MKLISKVGVAFLILLLDVVVICEAQERRTTAPELSQSEDAPTGFQCSTGEWNQPRPEVKLHLGDVTKKALQLPQPTYPRRSKAAHISGQVRAEVVIDILTGNVIWAQIKNGHPLLQESVRKVVCQAHFAPLLIDSPPVKASGIITYKSKHVNGNRIFGKRMRR